MQRAKNPLHKRTACYEIISRKAEHVACTRDMRNAYKIVVGKPERKTPHGRPRLRWEDTGMDVR
jgi:hypothetical protein